jgi:subtilisin family serine protease
MRNEAALQQVRLTPLMDQTQGHADVLVALIDGPVAPGIIPTLREPPNNSSKATPSLLSNPACEHGTLVAAMLAAPRGSPATAICPGCTLLVQPIFPKTMEGLPRIPSTTADVLAEAIIATIHAGARIINLSLSLTSSIRGERDLQLALDFAAQRGSVVIAAAGNQGVVGTSALCRHPWVIPVAGCESSGAPVGFSNLGASIGRRGLSAPATEIISLNPEGIATFFSGTSAAAPFVTGTIALLWSQYLGAAASAIKEAVMRPHAIHRAGIVPPLLDAWRAYEVLGHTR